MDLDAIDRLVAEKVMGYRLVSDTGGRTACWVKSDWPYIPWCFTPTLNREHAMMVFEQCPGMNLMDTISGYKARYEASWEDADVWHDDWRIAICLTALKKKNVEVQP